MGKIDRDEYILLFTIGEIKFGLRLSQVERVLPAVELSVLPGAPAVVDGVINLAGDTLPIVNFRKRLKKRKKEIHPSDKIIIVQTNELKLGFFVDEVVGLKELNSDKFKVTDDVIPHTNIVVEGVTIIDNEIVLIHDINRFFSIQEKNKLLKVLRF
ncbi:MAG: hypothetical protein C0595_12000 [Marinilabiliales bacterium]|nr:MAG: hypothetical protein C0595_12000 [Marinilabiliales bacterium]